jgi:plastocyanin
MSRYLFLLTVLFCSCASPSDESVHRSYTVEIQGMKFQPAEITVQKGDTVVWINRDMVDHDVTEEKNKEWTSSVLAPGKSWSMVAEKGADYFCSLHQVMKAKLIVK